MSTERDMSEKARRPMTEREVAQAEALNQCVLPVATPQKRFIRSLPMPEITERQARWLDSLAWTYRRQMPADLVPPSKPEPFA